MISEALFDRLSLHMRTREARGASAEELALLAEARAEIERLRLMRETSQEALRECMAELREVRGELERLRGALARILENEASDWKAAEEFGGYVLDDELREEARAALEGGEA